MRSCLVTGGAGFIGSHITEALVRRGDQVRVLDNLSTGNRQHLQSVEGQIDFLEGDITNFDDAKRAVAGVDSVFHQAALASVPRSVEKPLDTHHACVTGTLNLLHAAKKAGVRRVVYAASSSAYGNLRVQAKRETARPEPMSPYAAAKLAGELYCQAFFHTFELETVAIRYFNVFGPRQDPHSPYSAVIPLFITALLRGESPTVYDDGLQTRDFTFVDNVVHGNLLAAEAPLAPGQTINVANGHSTSLIELLTILNRLLKTEIKPQHAEPRPGDVKHSLADISLARELLGYEPQVDFETGLRQSVAYYRRILDT